ncbi:hypothetical protein BDV95DRAFT_612815 [Massariosphaeria phaeospora]|uniref:Uncharacterized protein n=1 Tax=Massariosphaeria phaeospora TaxID=100035 RepID=A0A7C8M1H6_9PLEO|nr:hypothetical protein BDV95DRAFT_612815 [Massariosphaeria phaeospora]
MPRKHSISRHRASLTAHVPSEEGEIQTPLLMKTQIFSPASLTVGLVSETPFLVLSHIAPHHLYTKDTSTLQPTPPLLALLNRTKTEYEITSRLLGPAVPDPPSLKADEPQLPPSSRRRDEVPQAVLQMEKSKQTIVPDSGPESSLEAAGSSESGEEHVATPQQATGADALESESEPEPEHVDTRPQPGGPAKKKTRRSKSRKAQRRPREEK